MKKVIFIIYILSFLFSCSKNENIQETIEPERSSHIVFAGEKFLVSIKKDLTNSTLKTDHPNIVSFEYLEENKVILIKTLECGSATIHVLDTNNNILAIIDVLALYFSSKNIEEIDMHPTFNTTVLVDSKDIKTKKSIEDELWSELNQRKGTLYSFDENTKEFTMDITQLGKKYKGTYNWTLDYLTLNYNNVTEKYEFKIATGRRDYIIQTDHTQKYQILYPNAGITLVKTQRLWHDWDVPYIK